MSKSRHEEFALFFERPTRESLRDLIKRHFGEANELDFKEEWPADIKIARHILGLANYGGGCLIIGMAEDPSGVVVAKGLSKLKDKADLQKGIQKYLPSQLQYTPLDFVYSDSEYPALVGKMFQVVIVEDLPRYLPFACSNDGEGIRAAAIYIRRGTNTDEANYYELQTVINRRLETEYSTQSEFNIDQELAELKLLFKEIERFYYIDPHEDGYDAYEASGLVEAKNPRYPDEDFDDFIVALIIAKKSRIKMLLKISSV